MHEAGAALHAEQLDEAAAVEVIAEGAHELRVQVVCGVRVLRLAADREQHRHRELLELLAEVVAPARTTHQRSSIRVEQRGHREASALEVGARVVEEVARVQLGAQPLAEALHRRREALARLAALLHAQRERERERERAVAVCEAYAAEAVRDERLLRRVRDVRLGQLRADRLHTHNARASSHSPRPLRVHSFLSPSAEGPLRPRASTHGHLITSMFSLVMYD